MPVDSQKLKALMDKYFGPMGGFLLEKELRLLDITDINSADESSRGRLAEGLFRDCFSTIMSETKAMIIYSEMESVLDVRIPPIEGSIRHSHAAITAPIEV